MYKQMFIVIIFTFQILYAQESNFKFSFLPSDLHFMPLKANMQEARLGILYYPDNANLKIDIGNNIDLIEFLFLKEKTKLTFGIEFTAYALSTNNNGKRLQIDAIDGFFGGNASISRITTNNNTLQLRIRIIHNSAHFVDGHYDNHNKSWKNNLEPIPFTRDFGELTIAHQLYYTFFNFKYYYGVTYATLIRPDYLKRYSFFCGFEINSNKIIKNFLNKEVNLFNAYHFSLMGVPAYLGSNHIMIGVKFGEWYKKGIVFYFSYYSGNNFFNEYINYKLKKYGVGFFIDFI